jgi:hypothetical protein
MHGDFHTPSGHRPGGRHVQSRSIFVLSELRTWDVANRATPSNVHTNPIADRDRHADPNRHAQPFANALS